MHYKMLCFPKTCHTVNLGGYHLHSKSIDVIVEMELLSRFCMCDFAKLNRNNGMKREKNKVSGKDHLKTFFLSMFE